MVESVDAPQESLSFNESSREEMLELKSCCIIESIAAVCELRRSKRRLFGGGVYVSESVSDIFNTSNDASRPPGRRNRTRFCLSVSIAVSIETNGMVDGDRCISIIFDA